jgi:hypothetical protein
MSFREELVKICLSRMLGTEDWKITGRKLDDVALDAVATADLVILEMERTKKVSVPIEIDTCDHGVAVGAYCSQCKIRENTRLYGRVSE